MTIGKSSYIWSDLSWVDLLKGIAIIGVFVDNWTHHLKLAYTPVLLHSISQILVLAVSPFVQVFFILSGLGLMVSYLRADPKGWSWKKWAWRRFTKIVLVYIIFVLVSFLLGMLGSWLYDSVNLTFSWGALLAYLSATRNFFPETWVWNEPMWFMPVIIGLYLCFPILAKLLVKWGPWRLLVIAALVTYATLGIAMGAGIEVGGHGNDLFSFWLLQFALGMALAYWRQEAPQTLGRLLGPIAFLVGAGLMAGSWALRTFSPAGKIFNDAFTSAGIFLLLLNLGWFIRAAVPITGRVLNALGQQSFLMFLIHYPIMRFLLPWLRVGVNPLLVFVSCGVYIALIYGLCRLISGPIGKLQAWAYQSLAARPSIGLQISGGRSL